MYLHYPFGMIMPDRKFNGPNYRFGFNGKENDNDVKGFGNQQDYGMRIYDDRLGRFMSVDPIYKEYPELTPYQFSSNRPIDGVDMDGLEYSPAGRYGPNQLARDNTSVVLMPMKAQFHVNAVSADEAERQGERRRQLNYQMSLRPGSFNDWRPATSEWDIQEQKRIRAREYDKIGYNDDGTKKPLTKLLDNQHFQKGSENLGVPMLEALAMADGIGAVRFLARSSIKFLAKQEFAVLTKTGTINPTAIRFSQNSISTSFQDGREVQTLIDQLKSGQKINIEPIRIVEKDNMVFTLDNRRLYAYQQAGVEVPYIKLESIPKKELGKFTTSNNGTSIDLRKPRK